MLDSYCPPATETIPMHDIEPVQIAIEGPNGEISFAAAEGLVITRTEPVAPEQAEPAGEPMQAEQEPADARRPPTSAPIGGSDSRTVGSQST